MTDDERKRAGNTVRITVNDDPIVFMPGDTIELQANGMIRWYPPDEAEALRMLDNIRIKETQSIIAHVKAKTIGDLRGRNSDQ